MPHKHINYIHHIMKSEWKSHPQGRHSPVNRENREDTTSQHTQQGNEEKVNEKERDRVRMEI